MGPKTKELIRVLGEMAAILANDGDMHWSSYILRVESRLKNSDFAGIEHFLGAFGGMGSLNDIVLGQGSVNGVFAWKPGCRELNERFSKLRSEAWMLAHEIKHDHEITS